MQRWLVKIVFLFFLPLCFLPEAVWSSDQAEFSQSPQWLNLLHYRKTLFGYKSEAEDPRFFVSPNGRVSPQEELQAELLEFSKNAELGCVFPARKQILARIFLDKSKSWPESNCEKLNLFRSQLKPKSVTLVFSSYFLNNPASTFGHTFLRINKQPHGQQRQELLDYGINFAATPTTNNPVMYSLSGLFGWFAGNFTSIPYYFKVQEYNDVESRDLWEYDLNLSEEEVTLLVDHFWELAHFEWKYYYLSQNCSYHMLTALEAVAPRLHLLSEIPFYVIPSDTVKALFYNQNLVGEIRYRASKRTYFLSRLHQLTPEQKNQFVALASLKNEKQIKESLKNFIQQDNVNTVKVFDTYIDYFDFLHYDQLIRPHSFVHDLKQDILLARSKLETPTQEMEIPTPKSEMPHLGHESARIGLSRSDLNQFHVSQRFALHDLLDPQEGYPRDAEVEFFHLELMIPQMDVDQFYAFQVKSLSPVEPYSHNLSWKLRVGTERNTDDACQDCREFILGGGVGGSLAWAHNHLFVTLLLTSDFDSSPDFTNVKWQQNLGSQFLLRWLPYQNFSSLFSAQYAHSLWVPSHEGWSYELENRLQLSHSWSLWVKSKQALYRKESLVGVNWFY